jgi:adenine-specific DNA-methyltransferase
MRTFKVKTYKNPVPFQVPLIPLQSNGVFPSTRFQGSKSKLVKWIIEKVSEIDFTSCLDAFGGTGAIAYQFKKMGKKVTYNDLLQFNYYFGVAMIENKNVLLSLEDINWILTRHNEIEYPKLIQNEFQDIYFTDHENNWLDQTITNINQINDKYKYAMAFFALCQSCIIKRPYNLFHRKNLYIRFADVKRSFGNKVSWDKPFDEWFRYFCDEINQSVFDNGFDNCAMQNDALDVKGDYDLVYIDTPYIAKNGSAVDYRDFYHFLEGLTFYDNWQKSIDFNSKHKRLIPRKNEWTNKQTIYHAFDKLFRHYNKSSIIVSYRSDGIPSEEELVVLLKQYKSNVRVEHFGLYKYALSKNIESKEILLIATDN